jgi:hypothetical protein
MGFIYVAYLAQMSPVPAIANCWFAEMFSAGLEKSPIFAMVIIHLKVGAQKNMVNGPAGCISRLLTPEGQGRLITTFCITGTIPSPISSSNIIN